MITFTEVEELLTKPGIARTHYRINESATEGPQCIQHDGKTTEVFTMERGIKFDLRVYDDNVAGIRDFIERVLKYHQYVQQWTGKPK